ncbi:MULTISPECIES: ABC transporter ATP-binding protein [unclassified Frigoribacterium]|uniref:ABC transporter ATP-binding protein n=1 Tax=unclassified Frigoribacterium TaxID=2627005 RepID=UPI001566611F|nr:MULTISPECIES: ABC transporter ATP-binding protein [unclassified Frigoribacterium]NQW86639.1 ABC transporter ATP-binding protein [Frigoribacterium sp. VKM Ac-2860]NQX07970.1 ABC transporter ATP-binding protein [Frigoribacterium sp. VKM Ac-2859]
MTPEPVVRVHDLTKTYGTATALHGLSFEVAAGETLGLLGPNGAGKSTTIEILEGYRDRSGGDVSVLGADPQHAGLDWKARLGIVLQTSGEQGTATVREQIAHFAGFYPNPRDVDEVIAAVGLEAKAGARIRSLSGGQRRRVDVALGVVGGPELLFLDEPTTGFDPEARRQFWQLIRSLSDDGTSIVLTTHYLDEAAQLSDRVAVIAQGRLVAQGRPDELGDEEARTPRVTWLDEHGRHDVRTSAPGALVADLHARGGEPRSLEVIRPSLEDVYLGLVATAEHVADGTRGATDAGDAQRASSSGVTS